MHRGCCPNPKRSLQASSTLTVNHNVITIFPYQVWAAFPPCIQRCRRMVFGTSCFRPSSPMMIQNFLWIFQIIGYCSNKLKISISEPRYDFDVIFTRTSDGVQFRETAALNVRNLLARTTRIEAEETDQLTIALDQLPWSEDNITLTQQAHFRYQAQMQVCLKSIQLRVKSARQVICG